MFIIVLANGRRGGRRAETVEQRVGRDTRRMIDGGGGGYEDGRALPIHIAIAGKNPQGYFSVFNSKIIIILNLLFIPMTVKL